MINVSDNDECHFAGTTAEWHYGKQRPKRCVLRRLLKTARDGADVTWCGKPSQTRAAATGKARSPMVDSRVQRAISNGDEADRRRRRASQSAGWRSSSASYEGAAPCWPSCFPYGRAHTQEFTVYTPIVGVTVTLEWILRSLR